MNSERPGGLDPSDAINEAVGRRSVRANVLHLMTSQVITWSLATAAAIVVPRFLGPASLGDLRLAGSLWLIVGAIVGLGLSGYLQLEIARAGPRGLTLMGPILVVRTFAFAVCSLGMTAYLLLSNVDSSFLLIAALIGVAGLLFQWSDVYATAFVGLEHMSPAAFANAFSKLFNLVAVVALLLLGFGAVSVVFVGVCSALVSLLYLLWKFQGTSRLELTCTWSVLRSLLKGGQPFFLMGLVLIMYQQVDSVVISWVTDTETLGWYAAAETLFGSLLFPATVIVGALFPTLGRLSSNSKEFNQLVIRTFEGFALIAFPVGFGTSLIAGHFVPVLYGDDFEPAGDVLAVLGPVAVLTYSTILFGTVALATGRGRTWIAVVSVSAVITVPLDLFLVPLAQAHYDNGAIGGAVSYLITETIQCFTGLVLLVPFLVNRATARRVARIVVATGFMVIAGWPFRKMFFAVPLLVGAVVYVLLVLTLRILSPGERQMIGVALARLGIRTTWSCLPSR